MEIIFSDDFRKEFRKIKDKTTRLKIIKQLRKLSEHAETGKPLRYDLKNHRSIQIAPFRIIYRIEKDRIIINCFDHRKDVYDCSFWVHTPQRACDPKMNTKNPAALIGRFVFHTPQLAAVGFLINAVGFRGLEPISIERTARLFFRFLFLHCSSESKETSGMCAVLFAPIGIGSK